MCIRDRCNKPVVIVALSNLRSVRIFATSIGCTEYGSPEALFWLLCALLHDVVEDTDYSLEDIERIFDSKVARIIDGLTKISDVYDQNVSMQAENFRKMLLTLSDDVRVILIKLADRLHNMRTIQFVSKKEKQIRKAKETMEIYAPLADRMGTVSYTHLRAHET